MRPPDPSDAVAADSAAPLQSRPADAPPPLIGGYHVRRAVASGSHGTLYFAHCPATGEPRALKVVPLTTPEQEARFLREARAAAALRHPDIVRIEAFGEEHARGWIAMAWLPGCDLTRYTRPPHLLPEGIALGAAARIAEALDHAHTQGVVHRDIKPANLRIDLAAGRVTLTDFGSAWMDDALRTASGVMVGTPRYMAPEQLSGAPVDGRADLYALGVVLFELLAGRAPFDDVSMGELMRRIATEPPPPLTALRPDLPPLLAGVIARLLAKAPGDRQANGRRVALELRTCARTLAPAQGTIAT